MSEQKTGMSENLLVAQHKVNFVDENGVIIAGVPIQGYKRIYTQNMVALIEPFTFKMWKFGIKKRPSQAYASNGLST